MSVHSPTVSQTLSLFRELHLISEREAGEVLAMLEPRFPYASAMAAADSIHLHIKVDDVSSLPHDLIRAAGTRPENQKDGYVKYPFAGGINMIFSSIDVAQDDLIASLPKPPKPLLDHVGVDFRQEIAPVRALFDAVPSRAAELGWRHVPQGSDDKPVYCCHVEVGRKHWVYPAGDATWTRPIEFAYGALKINAGSMGCDLRPIDPGHPAASQVPICGDHAPAGATQGDRDAGATYYDPRDLQHFADVGRFAAPLMEKFFQYYTAATGTDGALTRREKALIALAVAHAKQCPYCIDAYTTQCLATGSTPEQMHEALHVAAALSAGIDLVHGVQMQNALRAKGAI